MSPKLIVVHVSGYKMAWWERVLLYFVPMDRWSGEYTTGRFKTLFGKMYVYSIRYHTTMKQFDNTCGRYN